MLRETFIERCLATYGDIYDYSALCENPKYEHEVEIICKTHGSFIKPGRQFIAGHGCPKCRKPHSTKKSTEIFIAESKETYGDLYDYSRVDYTSSQNKVTIGCRVHNIWFDQLPWEHVLGKGCLKCGHERKADKLKLTTEIFIERSNLVHNNFYEYSESIYKGSGDKIKIKCPVHGFFMQRASGHMSGAGCIECGHKNRQCKNNSESKGVKPKSKRPRRYTQEDFLAKSIEVHGEKYDYSESKYVSSQEKVIISCPIHSQFLQTPYQHWHGAGCGKCGREASAKTMSWTQEEFISQCNITHNGFYNYEKSIYKGLTQDMVVLCPVHGEFEANAQAHRDGVRCRKCWGEGSRGPNFDTSEFIRRVTLVHGDIYDYSLAEYQGNKETIEIICLKHGSFFKRAKAHIDGSGCPSCNDYSQGELKIIHILNKNKINFVYNKTFEECRNPSTGKLLLFDFYIEQFDCPILIEYDGKQHFVPVEHWGGEERFIKSQERDLFKNDFCLKSNIRLIRISYKENILKRLKEELIIPNDFTM